MTNGDASGLSAIDPAALATFRDALGAYVDDLTANFASLTAAQPEDQLKAPVSALIRAAGVGAGRVVLARTETRVEGLGGRPDIGVDADGLLVGHVELKAPGNGADPTRFRDKRSRDQWDRFKALPNLIYTDGRHWALYRSGEQVGDTVVMPFDPTNHTGASVTANDAGPLLDLIAAFLGWSPVVPSTPRALAVMLAPPTRLLRNEVLADVTANGVMARLADEWRNTLFPDADDATFADGYAQTFTYALLLARLEGAEPPLDADRAASELDTDHALLAQTLRVLGQPAARQAIGMPVDLLQRVIGAVDAVKMNKGKDPWLYFYEDFLAAYDPLQRNNRGVYYTPFEVVSCQVRLCQHVLTDRLDKPSGFGEPDVVVLDPAVGTGTYPLTVIADTIADAVSRVGPGVAPQIANQLAQNVNAFELLVGPYAVSHLRLSRTLDAAGADLEANSVRVFLTDTLAHPAHQGFAAQATLFQQKLIEEQERASRVKAADTRVTVVIGNPPYDRDESETTSGSRRKGGMIRYAEDGKGGPGLIQDFIDPLDSETRRNAKTLYNDYVYFWRWAIWKVCEQHDDPGIVSFITASSFLGGRGFAGMREVMRREFDELWFVDLGGEGRGARQDDNVFSAIKTPVVITIAVRLPGVDAAVRRATPARCFYRYVSGSQQEKFDALAAMNELAEGNEWRSPDDGWQSKFVPGSGGAFADWPPLDDLMPWRDTGSHVYRSWPIAEAPDVLARRWTKLMAATPTDRAVLLKESRDRKATKSYADVFGGDRLAPVSDLPADTPAPQPHRYSFRSFDREWLLVDNRLADYPRPQLWRVASDRQVYLHTLVESPLGGGPAMVAHPYVPDCHAFRGSYGDKGVFPLWRDASATTPNVTAGLLQLLASMHGAEVAPEDLAAYIVGLLGTGAYTERFNEELGSSMARVPVTSNPELFAEVVDFGRDLLWWSTFGERFAPMDDNGKPVARLPLGTAKNTKAVPATPAGYPEAFRYDPLTETIHVGDGQFGPVAPAMWEFEVSGLKVVQSWLAYRMKKRSGRSSSELDAIRPTSWAFSAEFVELLAVVEHLVEVTPRAVDLLDRVVAGELIDSALFPVPTDEERRPPGRAQESSLTLDLGD